MHAVLARTPLRVRAIKTTFGDEEKPNRRYQNNIVSLNKLFYEKPKAISGEELKNIMINKFGPKHCMKVDSKHFTISYSHDIPTYMEYNLIANTINEFTIDPENVKMRIIESKVIYSGDNFIIKIPLQ